MKKTDLIIMWESVKELFKTIYKFLKLKYRRTNKQTILVFLCTIIVVSSVITQLRINNKKTAEVHNKTVIIKEVNKDLDSKEKLKLMAEEEKVLEMKKQWRYYREKIVG